MFDYTSHYRSCVFCLQESLGSSLLDPAQSKYVFFLDPEILSEDPTGITALSQCLEVAFDTWCQPDGEIEFKEQGHRLSEDLIKSLKETLKHCLKTDVDHMVFRDA